MFSPFDLFVIIIIIIFRRRDPFSEQQLFSGFGWREVYQGSWQTKSLGVEKVEQLDSHIKAICVPSPVSGQLWSLLTIPASFIPTPDDGPNFPKSLTTGVTDKKKHVGVIYVTLAWFMEISRENWNVISNI